MAITPAPVRCATPGIEVACTVRNTGKSAGATIVQLYATDVVGSTVRPVRELKGFAVDAMNRHPAIRSPRRVGEERRRNVDTE